MLGKVKNEREKKTSHKMLCIKYETQRPSKLSVTTISDRTGGTDQTLYYPTNARNVKT
jgi:hypothetical protein